MNICIWHKGIFCIKHIINIFRNKSRKLNIHCLFTSGLPREFSEVVTQYKKTELKTSTLDNNKRKQPTQQSAWNLLEQYSVTLALSGANIYATNALLNTILYVQIAAPQVTLTQNAQTLRNAQIA